MTDETQPEPTAVNLVEEAKKYAEEIKVQVAELKKVRDEMREIEAKKILGGRSEAGQPAPAPEISPQEYARKALLNQL